MATPTPTRADDQQSESATLAHQIERVPPLVEPVSALVREMSSRLYAVVVLIVLKYLQLSILTLLFFLATMRTYWNIPTVLYAWIGGVGVLISVVGLPVVVWIWLKRTVRP